MLLSQKITLFLLLFFAGFAYAKKDGSTDTIPGGRGFYTGMYIGSYFANKKTASLYDGYGFDLYNAKNIGFYNSPMYRKIILEFGGGFGQPDYIARELGVNQNEWSFDESDMPVNMRYNIAFNIGFQMKYNFSHTDALVLNVNASKLNVSGNFTIIVTNPSINPQAPNFQNIQTFQITGAEQRLQIQAGYQYIPDGEAPLSFMMEMGPIVTLAKFDKNQIHIKNLHIDLTTYYDQFGFMIQPSRILTGIGLGAYTGIGCNFNVHKKFTLQMLYTLSYERIKLGTPPPPMRLQHGEVCAAILNFKPKKMITSLLFVVLVMFTGGFIMYLMARYSERNGKNKKE